MATPINTIYSWFETGDFPTQAQFQASWSSFWHKDETIPMTNISGLSDQFGKFVLGSTFNTHLSDQNAHPYFAKKDASNLTPTNVNDWKAKLGVGDLPENIATYDYDLHDHVMMKDGTTKEATDLGKNIANSSLTSIAGSGMTLGAPYTWNTVNQSFSITGLPDKSADATFATMLVENTAGQVAKSNGKPFIKGMPSLLTDLEKTAWKTEMNGGWTTDTMSVALINPVIVEKSDTISFVQLVGANLNMPPNSFSVEICTGNSTPSNVTIVDTINNANVILESSSSLIFWYNFKDLPLGDYKIRLWNGVAYVLSGVTFSVVTNLTSYDLSQLTWTKKVIRDETNTTGSGDNQGARTNADYSNKGPADWEQIPFYVVGLISSQFGNMADDFYIEIKGYSDSETFRTELIGITNENIPSLNNSFLISTNARNLVTLTIVKKANIMTVVTKTGSSISSSSSSVSTDPLTPIKFKLLKSASDVYTPYLNLQIIKAYKIN